MREIKFRGVDIETGKYVYAELGEVSAEINQGYLTFLSNDIFTVERDSVAQLIAVDKNMREVYEGDKVIRVIPFGEDDTCEKYSPMAATFEDFAAICDGKIIKVENSK